MDKRLEQERESGLSMIMDELPNLSEPTYRFNVGDKVAFGGMSESTVEEVLFDGKVYGLRCLSRNKRFGKIEEETYYRITSWVNVHPIENKNTAFTKNQDLSISFMNNTIHSLIHRYYTFGINMNPDYQRDYVWTEEDEELLIDSIFLNADIGKFVLIRTNNTRYLYDILDGKQRLHTLIRFYENRFPYKGMYYNDLSPRDKNTFLNHMVSVGEIEETNREIILTQFLRLNRSGRKMDESHIEKVEKMLSEKDFR